jgi:peptide deformylase
MSIKPILQLGDSQLYELSTEVKFEELDTIKQIIQDLHDTIINFQKEFKCGRAIAAPQIGCKKRILYMYIDHPVVFINPVLIFSDEEMMELWDDCMSFPPLLVKVRRHLHCTIKYKDIEWKECSMELNRDLSELLQHEYDHLDGILAVQRAIDLKSFKMK